MIKKIKPEDKLRRVKDHPFFGMKSDSQKSPQVEGSRPRINVVPVHFQSPLVLFTYTTSRDFPIPLFSNQA
jgi:hypothetical protein